MAVTVKEQIRQWWIYKITNPKGRVYIGKTKVLQNRINQYKYGRHKKQLLIARSISKYGWDSHSFEIIDTFYSALSFANDKEMFWIRSWMSNMNKYPKQKGMNLTNGGDGSAGFKHTQEWKDKLSEMNKGKQYRLGSRVSEEVKLKISNFFKGRKRSAEEVATYMDKMIETKGRKVVVYNECGDFEKEYRCVTEASRGTGVSLSALHRRLKNQVKQSGKLIFKYK